MNIEHELLVIRLIILTLVDKSLLKHKVEHVVAPLEIFLGSVIGLYFDGFLVMEAMAAHSMSDSSLHPC